PFDALDRARRRARAVAGRQSPAALAIALELERVADGVLLVDEGRPPAVLEVVDAPLAHEGVLDAAEVDPHVRKLVREERPGVDVLVAVDRFPLVSGGVGGVALLGQWERRRTETEHVQQQPLSVTPP